MGAPTPKWDFIGFDNHSLPKDEAPSSRGSPTWEFNLGRELAPNLCGLMRSARNTKQHWQTSLLVSTVDGPKTCTSWQRWCWSIPTSAEFCPNQENAKMFYERVRIWNTHVNLLSELQRIAKTGESIPREATFIHGKP